jgi:hypothetical protein
MGCTTFYMSCTTFYMCCTTFYMSCTTFYMSCTTFYMGCTTFYMSCTTFYMGCTTFYMSCTTFYMGCTTFYMCYTILPARESNKNSLLALYYWLSQPQLELSLAQLSPSFFYLLVKLFSNRFNPYCHNDTYSSIALQIGPSKIHALPGSYNWNVFL